MPAPSIPKPPWMIRRTSADTANGDCARLIEVIETTIARRGNGKDDPIRIITQYWTLDGALLAEVDPAAR